jgi:tetratricopeptide (TPR) repeat protein
VLNRLVRAYFFDYQQKQFTMFPLDQAYCYGQIAAGSPSDADTAFTRAALHRRAAAWYNDAYRAAPPENTDFAEAGRQANGLAAFDQWARAGQYEQAAALLLDLDGPLAQAGRDSELVDLYAQVRGQVANLQTNRLCLLRLGKAYRRVGRTRDAIACFETALGMTPNHDQGEQTGTALSNLGWAFYELGDFKAALHHLEAALAIAQAQNNRQQEGKIRSGIGWVAYLRGQHEPAASHFQTALALYGSIGYAQGEAMNLGDLGEVRAAQGRYPEAIAHLQAALQVAQQLQLPREISFKGGYLAKAFLLAGDLDEAERAISNARRADIFANNANIAALAGLIAARRGQNAEAVIAFNQAVAHADKLLAHTLGFYGARYARALAKAGLALLEGNQHLTEAERDYALALAICSEAGVVAGQQALLATLMAGPQGHTLQSLRAIFA